MPYLPVLYDAELRASGWRDLIAEYGLGSVNELLCGRGPAGLRAAHLHHLATTTTKLEFDETTCSLLEKHGLDVVVIATMVSFVDNIVISNDTNQQIAAIGQNNANIALTDIWSGPRWQRLGHLKRGHLQNLTAVPLTVALAAKGRAVADIIDNAGYGLQGLIVQEMTTTDTSSEIFATGMTLHDAIGIVYRDVDGPIFPGTQRIRP